MLFVDFGAAIRLASTIVPLLLFIKIYGHKSTHSITVINGILDSFIRQIEPNLHEIHAKHDGVFL